MLRRSDVFSGRGFFQAASDAQNKHGCIYSMRAAFFLLVRRKNFCGHSAMRGKEGFYDGVKLCDNSDERKFGRKAVSAVGEVPRETVAFVFAHPDDESFSSACLIRGLRDAGHRPVLLLATKGDAGQKNGYAAHASREELAAIREKEMEKAAGILGLAAVEHLGLPDGKLKEIGQQRLVAGVVGFVARYRPRVIVTFPEDGMNFHPDHVAVSLAVTRAVVDGSCPSVEKLYVVLSDTLRAGGRRPSVVVDAKPGWAVKAEALRAHESQRLAVLRHFGNLDVCPEHRRYESFVLRWERGTDWPDRTETSLLDGLAGIADRPPLYRFPSAHIR